MVRCKKSILFAGTIIKQEKPQKPLVIRESTLIAAGALVNKSVPAGITFFGNPTALLT
jgi:hypothetical protein